MESLRKAFDVLEVFLAHDGEASLSEIADATKLNISTIHGILSYMRERGYISHKDKRGKYTLGYKCLEYGDVILKNMPISDIAMPHMKELNQITHETVSLVMFFDNIAVVLVRVESNHDLRVSGLSERLVPLHCTGLGKVLLAYKPEEYWEQYLSDKAMTAHTPYTITSLDELKKQLREVKLKGYGMDNQETGLGIINIAAPVRSRNGEVIAALGILGPTVRINKANMKEMISSVITSANKISRDLGYRG